MLVGDQLESFKLVRDNIVGKNHVLNGPYGFRKIVYCDWTASGRALSFLENFVQDQILPLYSNVHTDSNPLSFQMHYLREEARRIIGHSVNAHLKRDTIIFVGSGTTGALNCLLDSLRLKSNCNANLSFADDSQRPVVFLSSREHHSNLLPWRESICTIVMIENDPDTGCLDRKHLLAQLKLFASRPLKIGSFCAASNVTGVFEPNISEICSILHENGALAFWDFATAGPYMPIDMNPILSGDMSGKACGIDAMFLSPHKFPGGVGTSGVLIAKKYLFDSELPPASTGGGVVNFVSSSGHSYHRKIHIREEGGTPNIVGDIRAGLVFQLKHHIDPKVIMKRDLEISDRVFSFWSKNPKIQILGRSDVPRISIFSFVIYHQSGRFLHYNFVCALLSDLFGIQCRGGCVCSGPYSHSLLGIEPSLAEFYRGQLVDYKDVEVLRPGFTRLSIPYFFSDEAVDYVLRAVDFVANEGWKLLPQYILYAESNTWKHAENKVLLNRKWLGDISYASGKLEFLTNRNTKEGDSRETLQSYLDQAKLIVKKARHYTCHVEECKLMREDAERFRWFVYPEESYLNRLSIDDAESNYRNSSWVQEWLKTCPFAPGFNQNCKTHLTSAGDGFATKQSSSTVEHTFRIPKVPSAPQEMHPDLNVQEDKNFEALLPHNGSTDVIEDGCTTCPSLPNSGSCCLVASTCDGNSARCISASCLDLSRREKPVKIKSAAESLRKVETRIFKNMSRAIREFDLINPGDRVLVGVSGGKDSLTLLHFLLHMQKNCPFKFEIGAVTVDPQTLEYNPASLKIYLETLGVKYYYVSQPLISIAKKILPSSICSWCSRMKRGILHNVCIENSYNVLALAHHFDDLAESFFMYAFHNGKLDTIKSSTLVRDGKLKIIRPFVFVREKDTKIFASQHNLPVISENCPACFEEPKERARIKALLKSQERIFSGLFQNLLTALKPLMHPNLHLSQILSELITQSKPHLLKKYHPRQRHVTDS